LKRALSILFTARASREMDDARSWLEKHRGSERVEEMADELAKALDRLAILPEMGARVWTGSSWSKTLRRLLLRRSGYHLYYRVQPKAAQVVVLAVWHERRKRPKL
jgi:plasmid stabilization system protein ParE